jgi:hypothetical protein
MNPMIKQQFEIPAGFRKWTYALLGIGALALVAGFIFLGLSKDEHAQTRFWAVLLQNSVFFLLIVNASMFFVCVTTLAHGGWQVAFRRVPEAISTLVPVFSVIALLVFVGIILGHQHHIYHWIDKEHVEHDKILKGKSGFLNAGFFFAWTVITLGLWSFVGWKMRQLSKRYDEGPLDLDEAKRFTHSNTVWASAFVVIFGLTVGSTIPWLWLMSIDAHWYSTMYSWYTFASTFVAGMSLVAIFVVYLKGQGYLEYVSEEHIHDLGKFMFAFSVFWTYLWYSQFMLIWYANIPEETVYFKPRMQGPYRFIFFLNLVMNFVLPFLLLMRRGSKRNYTTIVYLAVLIILGHWVDFYQMVMPGPLGANYHLGWFEFGVLAFFAGLVMFLVGRALEKTPLVAKYHPFLKESIIHHT